MKRRRQSPPLARPATARVTASWQRPGLRVAAVVCALAVSGWATWRLRTNAEVPATALPPRPTTTRVSAALAQRLDAAEHDARTATTRLAGIAELGRLYHANNFLPEAENCWQVLRVAEPDEGRWCHYLADLRRTASDNPATLALTEETLARAPSYSPARLLLATLHFKAGNLDEAERHYRRCLEQTPRDPHAQLGLVRIALQRGQTASAATLLEKLLGDAPNFSTAHNLYAEYLAGAGDATGAARHRWLGQETFRYRDAEDPWLDELKVRCFDYDLLCTWGTTEAHTDQDERARNFFERAIALEPAKPRAYELLGALLIKRHDAAGTRDLLEAALPRLQATTSPEFYSTLSAAYRRLQQPADAIRIAQLGLGHNPSNPELLDTLGQSLAAAESHEEAVAAWRQALTENPNAANPNFNLATSLLVLGRLDEALAALDRSLTAQPTFRPTLLLRGEIELEAGHLELAERYLRPAFESNPRDAKAGRLLADWHQRVGAAAEAKGETAVAEKHYRDGLALQPEHEELTISLGVFYLVQARFAEAVGPLALYQRLRPEEAQGFLFLGQAYASLGQRDQARATLTQGADVADRTGKNKLAAHCRALLARL